MDNHCCALLQGKPIYHATPLHYVPSILTTGALLCKKDLGFGMARPTARRRDRMLALEGYVHCSLEPVTPLLLDKLSQGLPHVVLKFDTTRFRDEECAVLPCSTKAWRARWQCSPITDRNDIERLLRRKAAGNCCRGLELLIADGLSLEALSEILTFSSGDAELIDRHRSLWPELRRTLDGVAVSRYPVPGVNSDNTAAAEYFERCSRARRCFTPPPLRFD